MLSRKHFVVVLTGPGLTTTFHEWLWFAC